VITVKSESECRACGLTIRRGQSAYMLKLGGEWEAMCFRCCPHLVNDAERAKLLEALLTFNAQGVEWETFDDGEQYGLDASDHRLLADVFPAFGRYHFGKTDKDGLPAFLGGKYGQLPVWADAEMIAHMNARRDYVNAVAAWRAGLDPSSRQRLEDVEAVVEVTSGKSRRAARQKLRDLEKQLGRPEVNHD